LLLPPSAGDVPIAHDLVPRFRRNFVRFNYEMK
jgi:hypothetical protein